jgi:acetyl esterase/lipase
VTVLHAGAGPAVPGLAEAGADDPAMRLVDSLLAEPRIKAVAAYSADGLLLRADVPGDGGSLVTALICYRPDDGAGWHPVWAVRRAGQALPVRNGFAYARRDAGEQLVAARAADGSPERILHRTHGRIRMLARQPGADVLACTVAPPGIPGAHPRGLLAGSDSVWSDGPDAALGSARHPDGGWEVRIFPASGKGEARSLRVAVPAGAVLTGEVAWLGPATLLLGTHHPRPDGSRRFGLLAVADDGTPLRLLLRDDIHLSFPVQAPDGHAVAYLGTSVAGVDAPLAQSACLVRAGSLELRVLAAADGLWQRPCGWSGAGRLICTAEEGPRRRLYACDLGSGRWQEIPASDSVLSAQADPAGGSVAAVVSAPDRPPAVEVIDLRSRTARPAESTEMPALPGRLAYRAQRVPGVDGPLACWLCLPADGPARGTVAFFHGGPCKCWADWSWRWNPWPFVARGYAVILVEPPQSVGYPSTMRAGWGRWRTGIAAAAARQVAQARAGAGLAGTPLAVMGGSFGGYLALAVAALLRPELVVAHAAPLDLAQVAASSDVFWQWRREFGDLDRARARYTEQSLPPGDVPAGTRVLLSHGMNDDLVPSSETLRQHRSLISAGVRSEVAFFRSEGHSLSQPRSIRAWYRWALAACTDELDGHRREMGHD